jgi:predicted amidohydrolase
MTDLRIALYQSPIEWENPSINYERYSRKLLEIKGKADIVLLPEMFTTGFSMEATRIAEPFSEQMPGAIWMRNMAMELGAAVTGSIAVSAQGNFYNRLLWADSDGGMQWYDKRHLFSMAGEDKAYTRGKEKLIVEVNGWKICPLICYDLRFPVWSRNRLSEDSSVEYDVLVYVANWPVARKKAWDSLLVARAIENQCYVAGINRCGQDGNGLEYSGGSAVLTPFGEELCSSHINEECILLATLNAADLAQLRAKFPVLRDGDRFSIS